MDDTEVSKYAGLYAPNGATVAVAVAIAEHGGGTVNPSAVNRNSDGSIDVGIWQINSVHKRNHPQWTEAWLKDPKNNADAMATVSSNGSNWQPWTTYRNGAYRAYMERAQRARDKTSGSTSDLSISERLGDLAGLPGAVATNPLDAIGNVAAGIANLAETVGGFFSFITDPNTWRRVALVVLGGTVAVVGVAVLARGTEAGQTIEGVAKKVAA